MRILMGSGVPKRREGGVAAIIYNLGRELEKLGHQVTYIFQEDLVTPGSVPQRFNELIFSLRLARYIARRKSEFSIVNLHGPTGFPYGIRRRLFHSRNYPPFVMTLHALEEWRVHAMTREAKKGRAWNFSLKNRLWQRFFHQPRFRWSIYTADGIHAVCRDVWVMLQLKYNLDSDRVAYIPSGMEQRFFISRQYKTNASPRLLHAGTWLDDQRGIYYIRDALKKVRPQVPGFKMTFAGCGARAEAIKQFFGPELDDCIEIRPVIPAGGMQELFAEHDIFLFPSFIEALPLVIQEAMASGMPVITTETCGMPDLIQHEFNGLLVPPANAQAIEESILRLVRSFELRQNLGEAARETMKRYSWERAARRLESFYRHILSLEGRSDA